MHIGEGDYTNTENVIRTLLGVKATLVSARNRLDVGSGNLRGVRQCEPRRAAHEPTQAVTGQADDPLRQVEDRPVPVFEKRCDVREYRPVRNTVPSTATNTARPVRSGDLVSIAVPSAAEAKPWIVGSLLRLVKLPAKTPPAMGSGAPVRG